MKRDFATDIPDIIIDNNKIEQVFINLFVNSINAMHKEGTLEIKTYLEEGKDKKRVLIAEVCDSGPGIKKDILNKVFEPFFTTKQKEGGTGLGLSIVRNIIELHDGEIKLQNREKGSGLKVVLTFKVT